MRRHFLLIAIFCTITSSLTATDTERPNILLIYADDQSYKTLSCYPQSFRFARTAHIDALAQSGIRFDGAYLGSWCMPSRATMLTGRLPHAIESMRMEGKYPGSTYDPEQCPFWPRVFRQEGYHTAQIGKWHTGVDAGFGRDWDYQIVWNRPKHPENAGAYYERQRLAINGEEQLVDGYSTDNYSKWASEYIRGQHRDDGKPWFLWLCYGAVHGPAKPAPRHMGRYAGRNVPVPADIFPPRTNKPEYLHKTQAWTRGPGGMPVMGTNGEAFGDDSRQNARTYSQWVQQVNECALALDDGVGTVMTALKESGQLENTLVIYTADQGFGMGEHGFRTKLGPYDATYKSPLLISQPGTIAAAQVSPYAVSGPDLVATIAARAGITIPWAVQGRDLSPLLKAPALATWDSTVLFEHCGHSFGRDVGNTLREHPEDAVHSQVPWWFALRQGDWKYIRTLAQGEPEELYDLQRDPEELVNLAVNPDQRKTLDHLRARALEELRKTDADYLDALPAVK